MNQVFKKYKKMKKTYYLLTLLVLLVFTSCNTKIREAKEDNLIALIDDIWKTEQEPIRLRDSLMAIHGVDSELVKEQQLIIDKNHIVNEDRVKNILEKHGWPTKDMIGERGNWTICNVIQHSDNDVRIQYLPLMKQAVKDKKLEPRFLVRAEDRIATERGDLQIYGGQMKYYPETKSFNLWPVYDPENIDKRRTEIGLDSISVFLKNRFDFEWNLEEQIRRTREFELAKLNDSE
ncbi:DUF6624 domain-containing protein [Halomarinibacterium sedimenti]|nr:DUF6624 domain-containing protein [Halomarinibacterium sedimenti]